MCIPRLIFLIKLNKQGIKFIKSMLLTQLDKFRYGGKIYTDYRMDAVATIAGGDMILSFYTNTIFSFLVLA